MGLPTIFPRIRGAAVPEELARAQDNVTVTLGPVAQAVSQTPIMGVAPVWTALQLDAAFASSSSAPAAYYKDALMRVQSKGSATTAAGVAANAKVGELPPGFRPLEPQRLPVRGNGATAQFVAISPTGVITCEVAIGAGGSIDFGFSFLAER